MMKATQLLHNLGQSIWLDNITRDLLNSGTLNRYIAELSVTGLTSNPTIFDHAIKNSTAYDAAIRERLSKGKSGEALFFDCEEVLAQFADAGIDVNALAAQLQDEGAKSFVNSWNELMAVITSKSASLKQAVAG
jgi:transaldolase